MFKRHHSAGYLNNKLTIFQENLKRLRDSITRRQREKQKLGKHSGRWLPSAASPGVPSVLCHWGFPVRCVTGGPQCAVSLGVGIAAALDYPFFCGPSGQTACPGGNGWLEPPPTQRRRSSFLPWLPPWQLGKHRSQQREKPHSPDSGQPPPPAAKDNMQ